MRICLINPNLDGSPISNLGLAYIISSIEKNHEVKLLDMTFHVRNYPKYIILSLEEFRPDVIGLSVNSFTYRYALGIASLLKRSNPDIPLVYGGVHPTLLPEETIQHPLVDAICIGEGETSFKEYLQRIENNLEPEGVAGMWYKDSRGKVIRNQLRPFNEDLDSLDFPNWDYWQIDRYLNNNLYIIGSMPYMFSRGCPYSCSFCSGPAIRKAVPGRFYRHRSPENLIDEIKQNRIKYYSRGFKNVTFGDSTFGLDTVHLENFCSMYIKEKYHRELPWSCQTRADIVTDNWARLVASAGCCMVYLGIESGNDYIRTKVYRKEMTKEQIANAINTLRKNKIMYAFHIIIGCLEETRESIRDTMDMISAYKPVGTYFSFYQPLPKTELAEESKRYIIHEEKLAMPWNTPRIFTKHMRVYKLNNVMFKIKMKKMCSLFLIGIKLEGVKFIITILKYLCSIHGHRTMPFKSSYIAADLEQKYLSLYVLNDWQKHSH